MDRSLLLHMFFGVWVTISVFATPSIIHNAAINRRDVFKGVMNFIYFVTAVVVMIGIAPFVVIDELIRKTL